MELQLPWNYTKMGYSCSKNCGAGRFTHPASIWTRGVHLTTSFAGIWKPPPPFDHGAAFLQAPGIWDPTPVASVDTIRAIAYYPCSLSCKDNRFPLSLHAEIMVTLFLYLWCCGIEPQNRPSFCTRCSLSTTPVSCVRSPR